LPAEDVSRLDDVVIHHAAPTPTISRAQALAAAASEYDPAKLGAGVEAYLERITVEGSLKSANPVRERSVWIIRYSGLSQHVRGPGDADAAITLTTAYVFIDAETGELLFTDWY
jgi:ferredoxin-NADP reductase